MSIIKFLMKKAAPAIPVTWNSLDKSGLIALSDGNLTATMTGNGPGAVRATEGKNSGKWYWEITINILNTTHVGIGTSGATLNNHIGKDAYGYGYANNGDKWHNNSNESFGVSFWGDADFDVISVALDLDAGKIWWAKDGVWQDSGDPAAGTGEAYSGISGAFFPMVSVYQTNRGITANFGASAFAHSIPSGFTAYGG